MKAGETFRLMCPVTGMFRGLVRLRARAQAATIGGPWPVTAETPILDWTGDGENGEYPRWVYPKGHQFNAEGHELSSVGLR